MNIRILPKWVGMLAMLFVPLLSFAQSVLPWQENLGRATIEETAKAKQEWIQANPEAYKKLNGGVAYNATPQATEKKLEASVVVPAVVPSVQQKAVKNTVTRDFLLTAPAEQAAYIKAHPELYEITD